MRFRGLKSLGGGAVLAGCLACAPTAAAAQTVTAVPKLDLGRLMGTWYEIARLPNKAERHCLREVQVLYALGDKKNSFQIGTSCVLKDGTPDSYDGTGKMDKAGDGKLKLGWLPLFTSPYWVLATGPGYEWALIGSPKHKTLWILSRAATLDPAALTAIEATATAQGYDLSKLILPPQKH